jgi:glycosyltransferase involved in cell wall biosynthesis
MPDFSVVIPTYRRPAYLAEAVDSVLAQTHPPAEVIVVCDGPTAIPGGVERGVVRVVEQAQSGAAEARNTGVRESTAAWLCFLDDDDLWHPDRLRLAARHLDEHAACRALTTASWWFAGEATDGVDFVATDLAGCLANAASAEPVTDMAYLDIAGNSFDLLLERNRSNISGTTVRRDVLEQAGGFAAGYTCAEDWLMALNVARYTEWCYLDERLSFIRKHAGNNTTTNPTNGLVTLRAISEAWADRSRPVPPHRALAEYGLVYRWTIQGAVWSSIRRGQVRLAFRTLRQGLPLVPRLRDRAYVFVPPPVTWRIEHATRLRHAPVHVIRDG